MPKEENILTIDNSGTIQFTDGNIKVENVNDKNWEDIKTYVKYKRHVNDEIKLAKEAIKNADNEIALKMANDRLSRAQEYKKDLIEDYKKKTAALQTPRAELANSFNNPMVSSIIAMIEGFYRKQKQLRANMPDDRMLVNDELKQLMQLPNLEDKQNFLNQKDIPSEITTPLLGIGSSENMQLATLENQEIANAQKSFVILAEDANGIQTAMPILDQEGYLNLINNDQFKSKVEASNKLSLYSVNKEELISNMANISMADDKKAAIKALSSLKLLKTLDKSNYQKQESNQSINTLDEYNDHISQKLLPYYNSQEHTIDPQKVNWSDVARKGINIEKMSKEDIDRMLSGKPTNLVNTIKKDENGNIIKGQSRLLLNRNEHGVISISTAKVLEKPIIPNNILGTNLTEQQQKDLLKYGRIEAITVNAQNTKKTIIPFIDKTTNQLMYRDINKIKLPNEYKGIKLNDKHKSKLLTGATVAIAGLLDNQGVPYNGYARINPATGQIESVPVPNIEHRLQVAANNHGNRTESLAHDKDTTIDRAQQKNNDAPKPKINQPKFKIK